MIKQKICPICNELYTPRRYGLRLTRCCENPGCRFNYAQGVRAKEAQKEARKRRLEFYKKDIKTRREAAIRVFNRYILLRDKDRPCVSCGNTNGSIKYDAGHYVPAGSCSALRFDERNVNKQCSLYCNVHRSGNRSEYAKEIVKRYGQDVLDFLDGPQPKIKITANFYREIEERYKARIKEIFKEMGES